MNVGDLPVPELAAPETERESAIEAILSDTKTATTGLPALHECAGAIACGRRQILRR